jgi:hypothetical protein
VLSRFHNLLTYIYLSRLVCYPHWNGRKSCAICERSAEESLTTSPEEDDTSSPEGEGGAYKLGEIIADAEDIKSDSDIQASIQTLMDKIISAATISSTDDLLIVQRTQEEDQLHVQRTQEEDQLHVAPSHSVSTPSPVSDLGSLLQSKSYRYDTPEEAGNNFCKFVLLCCLYYYILISLHF